MVHPPTCSNSPSSEQVKAFSQSYNPVTVSVSQVTVYKAPFTISSFAFRTEKWSNLAMDDVLLLRRTPPLASFLVGWYKNRSVFNPQTSIQPKFFSQEQIA
jgi:hypothetical protein